MFVLFCWGRVLVFVYLFCFMWLVFFRAVFFRGQGPHNDFLFQSKTLGTSFIICEQGNTCLSKPPMLSLYWKQIYILLYFILAVCPNGFLSKGPLLLSHTLVDCFFPDSGQSRCQSVLEASLDYISHDHLHSFFFYPWMF